MGEMSALENLFQIITSSTSSTSSSSSSSSSSGGGVRETSHGRSNGGKRGSSSPSPTEDPELQALSPQERLVKKVQETLVSKGSSSGDRSRGVRKKVILRKEKSDGKIPRHGRRLGEGSKIKTKET